ncbi:APC family permease [Corallococcus llansteffanensis]|nr:APC family permease [Corallococcus llansteffanensis]
MAEERVDPERNLPRALLLGVIGVVTVLGDGECGRREAASGR